MSKKKRVDFRCKETLLNTVNIICEILGYSRTQLIELGLCEVLEKLIIENPNMNTNYKGMDLKKIVSIEKSRSLRRMKGIIRTEFLSKHLLINRIGYDLYKLISAKKKFYNQEQIKKICLEYLNIRKKEVKHYNDNEEIYKEIDMLELRLNKSIDNTLEYINTKLDIDKVIIKENGKRIINKTKTN